MKNLIYFFWFILPFMASSQNNLGQADDYARISLNVFIPEQVEGIPAGSKSLLINKLTQAATKKGMAGGGPQGRFLLTANMDVLAKDVIAGAPNKHAYQFEVSLFIVDFIDKNIAARPQDPMRGPGSVGIVLQQT